MGKYNRYLSHLKNAKRSNNPNFKNQKIRKLLRLNYNPIIIKVKENLFRDNAYNLEIEYIKNIGRKDLNEGYLCNMTNGGDGSSGYIRSKEASEKSAAKLRGRKRSKCICDKISKSLKAIKPLS